MGKIDLADLKLNHPVIHKAYRRAVVTGKSQPLGLGLANGLLSPTQLREAIKQALKNPFYIDSEGTSYNRAAKVPGDDSPEPSWRPLRRDDNLTPLIVLKSIRDVTNDRDKKNVLRRFQEKGNGIEAMLDRVDGILGQVPKEKVFVYDAAHVILLRETARFKQKIRALLEAKNLSVDDQIFIARYLELIGAA